MSKIKSISAIQILDSRGNPTVKTTVILDDGSSASASVPSGKSTGKYEATELRDGDPNRFGGLGVQKAIDNVNQVICRALVGLPIEELALLDKTMIGLDPAENKSTLGANAMLSVSMALARALSVAQKVPLWKTLSEYYFSEVTPRFPRLMVNIVNGGAHASWAFDIQEFMIVPKESKPSLSTQISQEVFATLGKLLEQKGLSILKGDEGGYAPHLAGNKQAFEMILTAAKEAGHTESIDLAIDAAASEFYKEGKYNLKKENRVLTSDELSAFYQLLITNYKLLSIEDPFAEEDWSAFTKFTSQFGGQTMIVGDDLYTTNVKRLEQGIKTRATNAILIKPNQIGTIYETVQAILTARQAKMKVVISHRSGETEDSFISDLSYACGADFLKAGSMSRSERLAKYNRLLEIEKIEII